MPILRRWGVSEGLRDRGLGVLFAWGGGVETFVYPAQLEEVTLIPNTSYLRRRLIQEDLG